MATGLTTPNSRYVVFGGMAKTGTTLPLTLLDGHPDLLVFPEELRFFHRAADVLPAATAAESFLANGNIQMLAARNQVFDPANYMAHGGTGFGRRDYSRFDFPAFEVGVREGFAAAATPRERFDAIANAFKRGLGLPEAQPCIFVCKAPHNEVHARKWAAMLGDDGRFVVTTRVPTEHFLSLSNIRDMQGKGRRKNPRAYAGLVAVRRAMWDAFGKERLLVLDYDRLISDQQAEMARLCAFIGVPWNDACATPTKMGVPWAGNSSRKIVAEAVFRNPHRAAQELLAAEILAIETGLSDLYAEFGWTRIGDAIARPGLRASLALHRGLARIGAALEDAARSPLAQRLRKGGRG